VDLLNNAEEHEELMLQIRKDQSSKLVYSLIEGDLSSAILNLAEKEHPASKINNGQSIDKPTLDIEEELVENIEESVFTSRTLDLNNIQPFAGEELW
jgi:hypothetical protein